MGVRGVEDWWMRVAETMLATSNNSKRDGSGRRQGVICFTAFGREEVSEVAGRQPNGGCLGGSSEASSSYSEMAAVTGLVAVRDPGTPPPLPSPRRCPPCPSWFTSGNIIHISVLISLFSPSTNCSHPSA